MKKLLLILISLIPTVTFAQVVTVVETEYFTIGYSEELEQPLWAEYSVACPNGTASRSGMDFFKDNEIHTSDDEDYVNNVWDKGHLAPASAFSCDKEMLRSTFTFLNSALQHQSLNRGVWNRLEGFEKDLANFFTVEVRIDVIFDENSQVLESGATVPSAFSKIIMFDGKTTTFEFPNEEIKGKRWIDFIQSYEY